VVAEELLEELCCSGGGFGCLSYGGLAGNLWFGKCSLFGSGAVGVWLMS
jgi:hypothetical protein